MGGLKGKFLKKIDGERDNKKNIENLVVFVIILIVTIIFINYIWNGGKKNTKSDNNNLESAKLSNIDISGNENGNAYNESGLEKQLENILKKLEGVEDVSVLITYEETNKVVPMYNVDNQESVTQEEDNQGGTRTINETSTKKEVVYEESNGGKTIVTSSIVTPEIKGAVVIAKGANRGNVRSNIIQAIEAATGLPTHKIQVFEMK